MYLLDTDHLSILERGGEITQRVISRLSILSPEDINVTVITYEEQNLSAIVKTILQAAT